MMHLNRTVAETSGSLPPFLLSLYTKQLAGLLEWSHHAHTPLWLVLTNATNSYEATMISGGRVLPTRTSGTPSVLRGGVPS